MSRPKKQPKRKPAPKRKPQQKWPGAFGKLNIPRGTRIRDNGLVDIF